MEVTQARQWEIRTKWAKKNKEEDWCEEGGRTRKCRNQRESLLVEQTDLLEKQQKSPRHWHRTRLGFFHQELLALMCDCYGLPRPSTDTCSPLLQKVESPNSHPSSDREKSEIFIGLLQNIVSCEVMLHGIQSYGEWKYYGTEIRSGDEFLLWGSVLSWFQCSALKKWEIFQNSLPSAK